MIVLHAAFPIREEKMDEALDLIDDLVEASNEEAGILTYRATRDLHDENTIRFFEQYEDEAAVEAHNQTSHFREFEAELPDLLAGEPELTRFDVADASEMDL